jgi:hypothetical protein
MFCSTCGVKVADSLSYCNHCGARIVRSNTEKAVMAREVKPELLVSMTVITFVFGLLALAVLLSVMHALGFNEGQVLAFACLSFLTMLLLEGAFLSLLFRRRRGLEDETTRALNARHATKELDAPQMQALPEPLTSVTDHTTRAFEPIYTNRNKTT